MEVQFRSFQCQTNSKSQRGGEQAQTHNAFSAFYECGANTKINCVINGPMQKSQGADTNAADSCQIKVNVEFIDSSFSEQSENFLMNSLLLDQFPDVKEQLEQYCANMPSEAAAQHEREQKLKFLTQGVLQQTMQRVISSVIIGNEGTQVMFDFTVIECDQDLVQALVNCTASALLSSSFQLKCIPAAICILLKDCGAAHQVDPSLEQITNMRQNFTHKLFVVVDSQKEEFIYCSIQPLSWSSAPGEDQANSSALDLEALEKVMGLALSCGKKIHEYMIESA